MPSNFIWSGLVEIHANADIFTLSILRVSWNALLILSILSIQFHVLVHHKSDWHHLAFSPCACVEVSDDTICRYIDMSVLKTFAQSTQVRMRYIIS